MFSDKTRIRRLGVVVVLALGLTACGTAGSGEDDPEGVASLGTGTTTSGGDTTDTTSGVEAPTDPNEAFVLYDKCMAQEGFPTNAAGQTDIGPTVEQSGGAGSDEGGAEGLSEQFAGPGGIEIAPEDMEEFEAAHQVCEAHLANMEGGVEFTPEQEAALQDAQLRVQQCLDEKGIDMELEFAGSGDEQGLVENEESDEQQPPSNQGEIDQEALDAAMEECLAIFDEYPELADHFAPPGS